jgi:hypothetical protein
MSSVVAAVPPRNNCQIIPFAVPVPARRKTDLICDVCQSAVPAEQGLLFCHICEKQQCGGCAGCGCTGDLPEGVVL